MEHAMTPTNSARRPSLGALLLIATGFAFTLPSAYGEELIARGSEWRYLDDGSNQGTAWRATDFDDSGWASGPARLGFGGDGEVTELDSGHITYYFRRSITIDNPDIAGLALALLRDDGAVVYLNGSEVYRTNMPGGAISYDTFASAGIEDDTYYEHEFDSSGLVAGTNVIAVEVHQSSLTSSDVGFDLSLETTTAAPGTNDLVSVGSTWSYLDDGSDQGTAWREVDFDDSAWESGPAQLGFGDGDEATVIASGHIAYYFRQQITIEDPDVAGLALSILRDDGAVVYVNGTEVYRTNMPGGTITYSTLASNAVESNEYQELEFESSVLTAGTNVVAVEVHQSSLSSSDVSFDFSLETTTTAPGANDIVSLGSAWRYLDDGSDQGNAWRAADFDDSDWESGPAQLGFGDGDEATELQSGHITYYFRHGFSADTAGVAGLELKLRRDDGAIVYFNGTEVVRSNMPAGEVAYDTITPDAASDDGQSLLSFTLSTDSLVQGDNVLAVEVHQVSLVSSDVSFDLSLAKIVASDAPELERGPYLQLGTPSSMIVRWRTDGFTDTKLSYGSAPDSLETTIEMTALTNEHEVSITGLDSNTRYYYEIGDSDTVLAGGDADHYFKTSPPPGADGPIRIWVIGDSGECAVAAQACVDATAVMDEYLEWTQDNDGRLADIILMLGDNAYTDGTDTQYTRGLFEVYTKVLRNHVLWPVPGNHEFGASDSPTQSGPYYEAFTLPKAAEAGGLATGTEAYYSFDYGNVHFVALDSHDTDRSAPTLPMRNICVERGNPGAMYNWLCEDLAATTQDFILSFWHHPPYTKGSHDSDSESQLFEMRERFVPVFERYGGDLNLTGHSHSYERSVLLDSHYETSDTYTRRIHAKDSSTGHPNLGGYEKDAGANQGSVYSVVGSSAKVTGELTQHPIMASWHHLLGSAVIDIHGTRMDAYFIDSEGNVRDTYRLAKRLDSDGDGVVDDDDNCPNVANEDQTDTDGDGEGDTCDSDDDDDGVDDENDAYPLDATRSVDETPPEIDVSDFTVEARFPAGINLTRSVYLDHVNVSDDADSLDQIRISITPLSPIGLGDHTVTFTATDRAGNTASATATVTVMDSTPPLIHAPDAVTINLFTTDEGVFVPATLIAKDSTWSYLDDGSDQGIAWREPDFDDSGWSSGPAQLGFNEGDEATLIQSGHITYYFRHEFTAANAASVGALAIELLRDDGAVVYLNGSEIHRDNMPAGDVDYQTRASGAVGGEAESTYFPAELPADALRGGDNVLAVEIHQSSSTSSDVSFNLELATTQPEESTDIVVAGATWRYLDDGSDQGAGWRDTGFDDSAWSSGPAQLGFGEGDEATTLNSGHITYYFRHTFDVADPAEIDSLRLYLKRDDGAVVYLNGTEVARDNLDEGEVTSATLADNAADDGDNFHEFEIDSSGVVAGANVLAVEVHQVSTTSSDLSFDLRLADVVEPPASGTVTATAAKVLRFVDSVTATDTVDTDVDLTHNLPVSLVIDAEIEVVFTATDDTGNSTTKSVMVLPKIGPDLTVPDDITVVSPDGSAVSQELPAIADFLGAATAYDQDGNELDVTNDAGDTLALGTTTVTFSATDGLGRTAEDTAGVTVGLDGDADGVLDDDDNCPAIANGGQTDTDLDGEGNDCDSDDDDDGTPDLDDAYPLDPNRSVEETDDGAAVGDHFVLMFPADMDPTRQGFARVINHSPRAGMVEIEAVDDDGMMFGPVSLEIDANETVHFNSEDLENGNTAKGLALGTGPGRGDWRLVLSSDLDIEVLGYIRTPSDGFLTSMHDLAAAGEDGRRRVAIFNPGSNLNQMSRLRMINPGDEPAEVTITGTDDAGESPGGEARVSIPARASTTLDASELESVGSPDGLGDGTGKWQLFVESDSPILVMNLMALPLTGHLTNLSTAPANVDAAGHTVPIFPAASDPSGREGFVRVINHAAVAGEVSIDAFDDTDRSYPTSTLTLAASQTVHFNSNDLELGNENKGLSGGTGAGEGDWRLVLGSELDIEVLAYIRTTDGFLTAMHDTVRREGDRHRVPTFNPGANTNQVSRLRLVNAGDEADATIWGIDDRGERSPGTASVSIPAGTSRTLSAQELEAGGDELDGQLGDGAGKWQLVVESEQPILVMSLLSSPTGHLTNLSTAPALEYAPAGEAIFNDRVVGKRIVREEPASHTDFLEDDRFRETQGAQMHEGGYTYSRTGPNEATVTFDYDGGDRCTWEATLHSRTGGSLSYTCDDGDSGGTSWWVTETSSDD